jgi:DHA1 family solute carrier family 18 vesicular amine transporter 1/2
MRNTPRSPFPLIAVGFAIFSDSFLYGLVVPLIPLSPAGVTSEAHIGFLYIGYALGVLLLTPLCGILADRIGRRFPLIAGAIVQLFATFLFAIAGSFEMLMFARIVQGGAAAATWTAGLAVIAEYYPDQRVQKMGLTMLGMTLGSLGGPAFGGLLYDLGGYFAPFWLGGLMVLVDLGMRVTLLPRDQKHTAGHNALPVLLRNRSVLVAALVVALIAGGWGVIEPHVPSHLNKTMGASSTTVGLLFTAAGLAYGLVTSPVQRMTERRGLRDTIVFGLILMAIGMPLLALAPNLILAAAMLCLVSAAYAFAMNPTLTELAEAVDRCAPGAYASVYAVFNIAYSIGMIGGDVVAGSLAHHFSLFAGFLALSVILLASLPLLWWSYKPSPAIRPA